MRHWNAHISALLACLSVSGAVLLRSGDGHAQSCSGPAILSAPACDGDGADADEHRLYDLVMQYRAANGLPAIPLSASLTRVANRHVRDLQENIGHLTHGFSDCRYDGGDVHCMWNAPQRYGTAYPSNGYEVAFGMNGFHATPESALQSWQHSPPHNTVILNRAPWRSAWNAIGVGIYQGYAVMWFGQDRDPAGAAGTSASASNDDSSDTDSDPCAQFNTCESCAAQAQCGWCGASNQCASGDANGAPSCGGQWVWTPQYCAGSQVQPSNPVPPNNPVQPSNPVPPSAQRAPSSHEADLQFCLDATNAFRARAGVAPVTRSPQLEAYAAEGARADAVSNRAHGHFSATRGGNGISFGENELPGWPLESGGSIHDIIGQGLQDMWSEGPGGGHYENMRRASFTQLGCGIYVTPSGQAWVVQDFR